MDCWLWLIDICYHYCKTRYLKEEYFVSVCTYLNQRKSYSKAKEDMLKGQLWLLNYCVTELLYLVFCILWTSGWACSYLISLITNLVIMYIML